MFPPSYNNIIPVYSRPQRALYSELHVAIWFLNLYGKTALETSDTPQEQLTQPKPAFIAYLKGIDPFASVFDLLPDHLDEVLAMTFEEPCQDWHSDNAASPLTLQVRDHANTT